MINFARYNFRFCLMDSQSLEIWWKSVKQGVLLFLL